MLNARLLNVGSMTTMAILAGCVGDNASSPTTGSAPPTPVETITVSVGPCFGFCPVYDVSLSPRGDVTFIGTRHTAVLGTRNRQIDRATGRRIASALAPYRPAGGTTARVDCDAAVTDTPTYSISWTDSAGVQSTANHQGGCPSGKGHELDAVLRDLPTFLGIADWASQKTRPGASRG